MAESFLLNTGSQIPTIGFGTWEITPASAAKAAVASALQAGYRLIDTAQMYDNEDGVGQAIRESGIDREDIFLTTKLSPNSYGHQSALEGFEASLSRLDLEYVDLYLMHWPAPFGSHDADTNSRLRKETWQAFEEIYKSGRAKNIGVSNFVVHHLEELLQYAEVLPAVDQIELHPFVYEEQRPIVESCQKYEIVVEAYSPLSRGGHINNPKVGEIAEAHGKTNAQVLIRWALQHDTVPLPRSTNPEHIAENLDVFDFELSAEEMRTLNGLTDSSARVAPDPHHMK
jgi:diketogulonate reductase-like aldo/keto reductase